MCKQQSSSIAVAIYIHPFEWLLVAQKSEQLSLHLIIDVSLGAVSKRMSNAFETLEHHTSDPCDRQLNGKDAAAKERSGHLCFKVPD